MGQVLLARDETLERDVAIKELDQPVGNDGGASARRTIREARAAARINHPNVVQVYDVLQLDDRTWIVMEYVPCRSLRDEIADRGPLDPYRVARIGLDLLGALRTAHRLGVEHRDVKPANVLLADDGRVLLTDFGIAAVDDDAVISRSDILVGSPQFMAPERVRNGTSGPEADLWSLGATLYAAIEGRSPYERGSTMATLTALTTEEPDPPQHAGVLRPLLDGLLRKDPLARMNAEDAESLARGILGELSGSGETPPPAKSAGGLAGFAAAFRIPKPRPVGGSARGSGTGSDARTGDESPKAVAGTGSAASDESPAPADDPDDGAGAGVGEPEVAAEAVENADRDGEPGRAHDADDASQKESPASDPETPAEAPGDAGAPAKTLNDVGSPAATRSDDGQLAGSGESADEPGAALGTGPGGEVPPDPIAGPGAGAGAGRAGVVSGVGRAPVRSSGRKRPERGLLIGGVVLALMLAAGTAWAVNNRTDGTDVGDPAAAPSAGASAGVGPDAAQAPEPSPSTGGASAPGNPDPGAGASPGAGAEPGASAEPSGSVPAADGGKPVLKAGWKEYTDPTGFSLYVPAGWKRSKNGSIVYFRGDNKILGIDQTDQPKSNPVKDWRTQADYRSGNGDFPGYKEIKIVKVDYFRTAADWEFTFNRNGVRRHTNNRGTVISDKKAYGFYWETNDDAWAGSLDDLKLVFDSFQPAK
ncbi:hypothetical protein J3R03_005620 [Actinoplanes couchii]|uniref:Serine/threonine protein kinase n=3 Tax=Actinoplanes couchii TaxID=403638 RepID=A0ABQ3XDQ7_9ACTN|nr:hypothetical protein [Actinoplanes couchii]GID56535.1 serine/threonine protein kinase [Actinoplanes couchii]